MATNNKKNEKLQQEEVVATISKTEEFYNQHKKTIWIAIICVLVAGLGILGYSKFIYAPAAKEAQEAAFPAAVDDVRAAVHFLAENAGQYGYDMEKVAIWGESAGGYLAAREAVSETDVKISAMVDYYGIMEFPQNVPMLHAEGIPQFVLNIANGWLNKDLEQRTKSNY